jgi:ribosomal protein S9
MAKRKAMTKAQKAMNAKIKKELQEKGIVPPDKPRLNRKKYIEEAREEWNGRDAEYYA